MSVTRLRLVALLAAACVVLAPVAVSAKGDPALDETKRIGFRASADGVELRVYSRDIDFGVPAGVPASCTPDQQVNVQLSTRELAQQLSFPAKAEKGFTPQAQTTGQQVGAPVNVALARLPHGAARARMVFEDGTADEAGAMRDGWVVLAAKVPAAEPEADPRRVPLLNHPIGTMRFLDDDGKRVGKPVDVRAYAPSSPECDGGAQQPVPLPEPTGPPPADRRAAREAVTAAYELVYTADQDIGSEERVAAIEDGASVLGVLEEIRELYPDVGPVKLEIDKIIFLNDHEAAVRFDLLLDGRPITAQTAGRALLVDGEWKMAKSTYCEVVGRGGIVC